MMVSIGVVPRVHGLSASFASLPTSRKLSLATAISRYLSHALLGIRALE